MTLKEMKEQIRSKTMLDAVELRTYLLEIISKLEEMEKKIPVQDSFRI